MLFQGQEFMEDGSFNDYSALDWEKANKLKGIVEAHKHLIALRKNQYNSTLGLSEHGFTVIHVNEGDKMLAYHRYSQGSPGDDVVIVLNFANKVQKNYGIDFPRNGLWRVRFNSDWKGYSEDFKNIETKDVAVENNKGTFDIGPYSSLIFSQDT
jgi:1,4-alpha-glucan branching enzyme